MPQRSGVPSGLDRVAGARLFAACLAVVAIAAVVRTDAFGYASGLWQHVHDMLDCGKTDLGFARLVHFLALAYIVYHSGLTGLMRRTRAFLPLCLIGRYSLRAAQPMRVRLARVGHSTPGHGGSPGAVGGRGCGHNRRIPAPCSSAGPDPAADCTAYIV
jgi:hypothetical protein